MIDHLVPNYVVCVACGKAHEASSKDFVAIAGNITIGLSDGVIGNNLHEGYYEGDDVRVLHVSIFCRGTCFLNAVTSCCHTNPLPRIEMCAANDRSPL